ncbi:MAG: hypothetical protein JWO31_351 [Phycisphaerales bacterium]|nr:hypothetical protein [Phycisphaerales bacterium]
MFNAIAYGESGADDGNGGYRRRRGWSKAKRAFGPGDLGEQLIRLERSGLGCPRLLLEAAIHQFLSGGPEASARAIGRYLDSFAPRAEALSGRELEELILLETRLNRAGLGPRAEGTRDRRV